MTQKETFLKIDSYEEYQRRREEFKGLEVDEDVRDHIKRLFPKVSNTKEELFKTRPSNGKRRA